MLDRVKKVTACELDPRMVAELQKRLAQLEEEAKQTDEQLEAMIQQIAPAASTAATAHKTTMEEIAKWLVAWQNEQAQARAPP